jgi:probable rRNA maturation factor
MPVETICEDSRWQDAGFPALAEAAAGSALRHLGLDPDAFEIAILATDDSRIAALNAEFRGKAQPTNVLSWPSEERGAAREGAPPDPPGPGTADDPAPLGDIALAWETCLREAEQAGRPHADHLRHLVVHGVLHLLGYDHVRDGDAALMERLEVEILASLGVADPYSEAG